MTYHKACTCPNATATVGGITIDGTVNKGYAYVTTITQHPGPVCDECLTPWIVVLEWTSTKPTKPGYYWLRNGETADGDMIDMYIVLISESLGMTDISYHGTDEINYVHQMVKGEWYGPSNRPSHSSSLCVLCDLCGYLLLPKKRRKNDVLSLIPIIYLFIR